MNHAIVTGPVQAIRSGQWAAGAVTAHAAAVPTYAPTIAAWALSYVRPLREMFDELLGDPAAVDAVAASWSNVEAELIDIAADLERAERQLEELDGRTIRTLRLRYEDLIPSAHRAAAWSGSVAFAAKLASDVVAGVRQFIYEFLASVARLIGALFGFTFNPFDKVKDLYKLTEAVFEFVVAGSQLIDDMLSAFTHLIELLQSLGPAIDETLVMLRETLANMLPTMGALTGAMWAGPIGMVVGGSFGAAKRDMLIDIGDVTRYDQQSLETTRALLIRELEARGGADALARAEAIRSGNLANLADLVQANSLTDRLGGETSTAIDVKLVRGADGNEHWVVSLPSTQEWLDTAGTGAMNDRNTNLSLMFMDNPVLKSQYEATVLRAMRESGMAPGDPVVFTGFSQGGIMAVNLAADPSLPYNTVGVVTNGSPIDSFDVPPHIPVVAFQHANDPVAMLDGNNTGATPPNVERVVLPAPGGVLDVVAAHSNNTYAESIAEHAAGVSGDYSWMGGEVLDHQVFEGVQR